MWLPGDAREKLLVRRPGIPRVWRGLFETRVASEEHEIEGADRAIALLRDYQFSLVALLFGYVRLVEV